jgi:thioredoxin reductase (NADPH)
MKEKLIILGSGPAGCTAAIYAARAELKPLVLEGSTPGGQLTGTTVVENWPGNVDDKTGPVLMMDLKNQAKKFGARFEMKKIDRVDFSDPKNLKLWAGETEFKTECLIIATGANARWLNLGKGEEKYWGKGYTACATCDGAFFRDKIVAVVGGGDTACEEAHFLTRFAKKVYLVYRGTKEGMKASKPMQQRVFEDEKIEILFSQNVTDLRGEPVLKSLELTHSETKEVSELAVNGLFMAIGHDPSSKFLAGQIETGPGGFINVKNHSETNVPSVFVAGDVSDGRYRQAIAAAGSGCKAALDAEHYLTNK